MADEILTETRGRVRVITLHRPEARNAVNSALGQGLVAAIQAMDADNDVIFLDADDVVVKVIDDIPVDTGDTDTGVVEEEAKVLGAGRGVPLGVDHLAGRLLHVLRLLGRVGLLAEHGGGGEKSVSSHFSVSISSFRESFTPGLQPLFDGGTLLASV